MVRKLPMNPFATAKILSPATSSRHYQRERFGRVPLTKVGPRGISADNNRTCFANMVLPHLDDAYNLAMWLTDDRKDAEDVVQDACLLAFHTINSFAGSNGRVWFLRIVRYRAHMWLRNNRPATLAQWDGAEAIEPARSIAGDAHVETSEMALIAKTDITRLKAAISALPGPFLETVVLREIHMLNYREIAYVTEVPLGTVMSRLARGRRRLIAAIGKTNP
jgi:RNA polymerase sigma factor (sigma-70 family)